MSSISVTDHAFDDMSNYSFPNLESQDFLLGLAFSSFFFHLFLLVGG